MKKSPLPIAAAILCLLSTACEHHDDFAFTGTVVGYEYCESNIQDFAYLIALDSPDSLGARAEVADGTVYDNIVVAHQSPRILKDKSKISGDMYIDNNYAKAHCSYRYTYNDPDHPEDEIELPHAVFTSVKVLK